MSNREKSPSEQLPEMMAGMTLATVVSGLGMALTAAVSKLQAGQATAAIADIKTALRTALAELEREPPDSAAPRR